MRRSFEHHYPRQITNISSSVKQVIVSEAGSVQQCSSVEEELDRVDIMSLVEQFVDYSMGGIDYSNSEMGGEECLNLITPPSRLLCVLVCLIVALLVLRTVNKERLRPKITFTQAMEHDYYSKSRMTLLVMTCVIFGIQLGMKLMKRISIFMLCPCHVQTFTWIYLLASKPSPFHAQVRQLVHILSLGPVEALAFPTDDWLVLPFEWEIFWIQHIFIAAMPIISIWMEHHIYNDHEQNILDWDWIKTSYFVWIMWLTQFSHALSYLTTVNIGHTLCPAYSDPLGGPFFAYAILIHQFPLLAVVSATIKILGRIPNLVKKWAK